MTKTLGTMTAMNRIISQVKRVTPLSKLVSHVAVSHPGKLAKEVPAPVWTTTAVPVPLSASLPMKQTFGKSVGASLGRERLPPISPGHCLAVREASFRNRSFAANTRDEPG